MNKKGYALQPKTCSTFIFADRKFLGRKIRAECFERPLVSIVFPTMNRLDSLKKTITSILKEMDEIGDYEIVVVDGQSSDGTPEYLQSLPDVRILTETELKGTVSAFDMALRAAKGEWVCWLNDDIEVMPGAFKHMLAFMTDPENSDVGMGAFANSRSGKELNNFVIRGAWELPVVYADFGFLRRKLLDAVGYLDSRFQKFAWDPDLAMKIWDCGLRVAPCADAKIMHYFIEDGGRRNDEAKRKADSQLFFDKWNDKYHSGSLHAVWRDPGYYRNVAPLLDGWPQLNLQLHFGDTKDILERGRDIFARRPETLNAYYTFALRLMNHGLLDEANIALQDVAQADTATPVQRQWAYFKIGECLERQGNESEAYQWFSKTLSLNPDHARARLHSLSETVPLMVSVNCDRKSKDRISLTMDILKASEWDYYFSRRPADDLLLEIDPINFDLDFRKTARTLGLVISKYGVFKIVFRGDEIRVAHKPAIFRKALEENGFAVAQRHWSTLTGKRNDILPVKFELNSKGP